MRLTLTILTFLVTAICSGQNVVDTLQVAPDANIQQNSTNEGKAKAATASSGPRMKWGDIAYRGNPWVQNTDLPYTITKGLQGRHLSVTASHGRYYDLNEHKWLWQRPPLYCTTEDLFTQTFVVPLLYPMLEKAGAIVWTPRERSWMREEVIVDNDTPGKSGLYIEQNGKNEWQAAGSGFAWLRDIYLDGQNPHEEGTSRMVEAQTSKRSPSTVTWTPKVPKDGEYAVYVSYPTMPTNVPDAQYTIRHKGIATHVKVNQQMGGGTWVYVGTYDFSAGQSRDNSITLTNVSNYRGVVSADAVRLGGGMGNVARCDTTSVNPTVSGLPRYLEGARYSQLWNGLPYTVYSVKESKHDYNDDIVTRPHATNYMARGSVYLPGDTGLNVPLEACIAVHSDAGWTRDNSIVGSLGLFTSDFEEGLLPSGLSRKAAGQLSAEMLKQLKNDLNKLYGNWVCRDNRDRNYGESRVPRLPGVILEMFSHQNYADMQLGHDPNFKFDFARAIYKAVLRYTAMMHGTSDVVIQPLPVQALSVVADKINHRITLTWKPTQDNLEPTATPDGYIVYQRIADGGWDNGTLTTEQTFHVEATEDVLYRFKVEAVNAGGASMPSEELCAMLSSSPEAKDILIVNGFTRLAAPYSFDKDSLRGFRFDEDPGVARYCTPEYCGPQVYFNKDGITSEKSDGLGYSSQQWIGMLMKGNTFDYPSQHASDLMTVGPFNISSTSRQALEDGDIAAEAYDMMDLIMGAQRKDEYTRKTFKTFTTALQNKLHTFTENGGRLLVSGAYVGTDMQSEEEKTFTSHVMHYQCDGQERADSLLIIEGMNTGCSLNMQPNEEHLSTAYTSILKPAGTAFSILLYPSTQHSAAIAYQGADYKCIAVGFPIEHIQENEVRRQLMAAFVNFLMR